MFAHLPIFGEFVNIVTFYRLFQACEDEPCNATLTLSCTDVFPAQFFCACQRGWEGISARLAFYIDTLGLLNAHLHQSRGY